MFLSEKQVTSVDPCGWRVRTIEQTRLHSHLEELTLHRQPEPELRMDPGGQRRSHMRSFSDDLTSVTTPTSDVPQSPPFSPTLQPTSPTALATKGGSVCTSECARVYAHMHVWMRMCMCTHSRKSVPVYLYYYATSVCGCQGVWMCVCVWCGPPQLEYRMLLITGNPATTSYFITLYCAITCCHIFPACVAPSSCVVRRVCPSLRCAQLFFHSCLCLPFSWHWPFYVWSLHLFVYCLVWLLSFHVWIFFMTFGISSLLSASVLFTHFVCYLSDASPIAFSFSMLLPPCVSSHFKNEIFSIFWEFVFWLFHVFTVMIHVSPILSRT